MVKDMIGKKFGLLLVVAKSEKRCNRGSVYWFCECDCGTKGVEALGTELRKGKKKSCGCLKSRMLGQPSYNRADITGDRYGSLVVVEYMYTKKKKPYWRCLCDCGGEVITITGSLRSGLTRSCGCLQKEVQNNLGNLNRTHGMKGTPLYSRWSGMRKRCFYEKCRSYKDYGGRGIKICDEWEDFQNFYDWAMESGYDENLSLERMDNDGDYCPSNCRWATAIEQASNKRNNVLITYNGQTKTSAEWSRELGINKTTLSRRMRDGWPVGMALTAKPNQYRNNKLVKKSKKKKT